MIAPIQRTEAPRRSRIMRRVHRLVASTLLKQRSHPADDTPDVPAWRAWLFAGWVVLVTTAYFGYMLGRF